MAKKARVKFWKGEGWQEFLRLLVYFKPYTALVTVAFGCALLVSGAGSATAYLVKPAMDRIFANPDKSEARMWLQFLPFLVIGIYAMKGVFRFVQNYVLRVVGQRVIRRIRQELYEKYQMLSVDYYTDTNTGVMMSRITNDVNMMERAVSSLTNLFREPVTILGLAIVAIFMWWDMALIIIVLFSLTAYPIVRFGKKVRKYTKRGQESMGELTSILKENFTGIRVIKAFAMEKYEQQRFDDENQRNYSANVKRVKWEEITAPAIEALGSLAAAAVIFYGGMQVIGDKISPGSFFSFLAALGMMYEPIKRTGRMNNAFQSALAAAQRVFEVVDTVATVADPPGARELPPVRDGVHLENVHFHYGDPNEAVLRGVDLDVKIGQTVAIVGGSGAGKTTLINLIPRFYDTTGGRVLIDGHDIRELRLESLRLQIALVTQDTFLFDDTVRNNIAYGQAEAEFDKVVRVAEMAHAHEFITSFPNGYDTRIGELGVKLSGGQRQRLAIARALFKNAPILILDEATSALDTESEREVQHALENLMRGRTTFVIAHRLSTIRRADRIVVLRDGQVVEDGDHDALMARNGEYARLYNLQFHDHD
ncbi:MAG: lipid A export permease/ATP-binding protein MsbA [Candidatus Lernaella stagnicola]|nr:lipid A export permease/ATP-binding protein MsbA [Candidatus Lernaella stagnicola]